MQSFTRILLGLACIALVASRVASAEPPVSPRELLEKSHRVLFLGDSITASGQYVADFDAWLVSLRLPATPVVIDAGLASETVSGLSEEGHAGGAFPRPDLFERLDRVLDKTKPDLVIACYGMNCGIYLPLSAERFERYQVGMRRLEKRVREVGAQFIAVTPPVYDDGPSPGDASYSAVLDRYSQWLVEQRQIGWRVVDLHSAMKEEIAKRRQANPKFTFQGDRVHPDDAGHWCMAQSLIRYFGDEQAAAASDPAAMLTVRGAPAGLLILVSQRVNVLRDSYVAAAGHKRPGVAAGMPIDAAERRADELTAEIKQLLAKR